MSIELGVVVGCANSMTSSRAWASDYWWVALLVAFVILVAIELGSSFGLDRSGQFAVLAGCVAFVHLLAGALVGSWTVGPLSLIVLLLGAPLVLVAAPQGVRLVEKLGEARRRD